jgi:hypothetical protein
VYAASWLKERDLAETTVEQYEGILRNHVQPHLGDRALSEIQEPVIRQWRKTLQDTGVGAATAAKAYWMVHSSSTPQLTTCSFAGTRAGSRELARQGGRTAHAHD